MPAVELAYVAAKVVSIALLSLPVGMALCKLRLSHHDAHDEVPEMPRLLIVSLVALAVIALHSKGDLAVHLGFLAR